MNHSSCDSLTRSFLVLTALVFSVACGGSGRRQDTGACTPGESDACTCTSGQAGAQTCDDEGRFGACVCDDSPDMANQSNAVCTTDGESCNDKDGCTVDDVCQGGVCSGSPRVCDAPPSPSCNADGSLRTYHGTGTCAASKCGNYPYTDTPCDLGCQSGACRTSLEWQIGYVGGSGSNLYAVWGSGPLDVYMAGGAPIDLWDGGGIYQPFITHSDGGDFTEEPVDSTIMFLSLFGNSEGDVYAVGQQQAIFHSVGGGAEWTQQHFGTGLLNDVWGTSAVNMYAVGSSGTVLHSNGTWGAQTSGTTSSLNGIWGSSASDIYAVGSGGTILHSAGDGNWVKQTSGVSVELRRVWGTSANNVYAVGASGVILHSTGDGTWTAETTPTGGTLRGVWGSGATDLYAVGEGGVILHSTGNGSWKKQTSGTTKDLYCVWGASATEVFATGQLGVVAYLQ